jgi:flagellar biosynthesis GTPase FlhF
MLANTLLSDIEDMNMKEKSENSHENMREESEDTQENIKVESENEKDSIKAESEDTQESMKEEFDNAQQSMRAESDNELDSINDESEDAQQSINDESEDAQQSMNEEPENVQECMKSRWIRGAFVLFFLLAMRVAALLVLCVAVFQFLHTLFTARVNLRAQEFGKTLGFYLNETAQFVSYNVDTKPWPFTKWPSINSPTETDE